MRPVLFALLCSFVLHAAPARAQQAAPEKPQTTQAPPKKQAASKASIPGAVVGGIVGLAVGVPLVLLTGLVTAVCLGSMGIVLFQVQDWETGAFKLDEDSTTRENKELIQRRMWTWGRNAFPFAFIGLLMGITVTAAAAATLVGGLITMPQE
jgi:protein-S-isoprenylcysteine O-methyltransferase Ste14